MSNEAFFNSRWLKDGKLDKKKEEKHKLYQSLYLNLLVHRKYVPYYKGNIKRPLLGCLGPHANTPTKARDQG